MHDLLLCFKFDFCVFLEASQMFEPVSLGPILLSKKFVMFGDYYTLNPICKSQEADKLGMTIPLHRRLAENYPKRAVILRI
jgi:superfamily I DNA and/or RNA helicase